MCLAYTALQRYGPRPVQKRCKPSIGWLYIMLQECLMSDKSRCVHTSPYKKEGGFPHSNDAIENGVVTFFFKHS